VRRIVLFPLGFALSFQWALIYPFSLVVLWFPDFFASGKSPLGSSQKLSGVNWFCRHILFILVGQSQHIRQREGTSHRHGLGVNYRCFWLRINAKEAIIYLKSVFKEQ
jgi:hypothetical protein